MPFIHEDKTSDNQTTLTLKEAPPGTLFIFEEEQLCFAVIKIKLDEYDEDGDPQYAYLYDGMISGGIGTWLIYEVNLPVGEASLVK